MINEYVGIVDYYDNLLTSGYFDFEALSQTLYQALGNRRKILDIGVGTGLLTEEMLRLANYEIVGVDFSSGMLDIAKKRLANSNVNLIFEDITQFETSDQFEGIVSTGGAIYIIKEEGEYRLYSHITDPDTNQQLLTKLYRHLDDNGLLALGIQGPHNNYKKEIKDNVIYEQRVTKQDSYVDKRYTFSNQNGEVLTEQFCRFCVFDGKQTQQLLKNAGFTQAPQIIDERFWISCK